MKFFGMDPNRYEMYPTSRKIHLNNTIIYIIYGIIRSFPLIFNNATMLYNATFTLSDDYSKYSLGDESTLWAPSQ